MGVTKIIMAKKKKKNGTSQQPRERLTPRQMISIEAREIGRRTRPKITSKKMVPRIGEIRTGDITVQILIKSKKIDAPLVTLTNAKEANFEMRTSGLRAIQAGKPYVVYATDLRNKRIINEIENFMVTGKKKTKPVKPIRVYESKGKKYYVFELKKRMPGR